MLERNAAKSKARLQLFRSNKWRFLDKAVFSKIVGWELESPTYNSHYHIDPIEFLHFLLNSELQEFFWNLEIDTAI